MNKVVSIWTYEHHMGLRLCKVAEVTAETDNMVQYKTRLGRLKWAPKNDYHRVEPLLTNKPTSKLSKEKS